MKKEEVPQDNHELLNGSKEIQYAVDEEGNYVRIKSSGWETKALILQQAHDDILADTEEAKELVMNGEKSPIYYFMIKNMMNVKLLAEYVGFSKFKVKRHLKVKVFNKLNDNTLIKYCEVFDINIDNLKNP